MLQVVLHHVPGNRGNALLGLQQIASGAILLLDRQQLFLATVLEQVLELGFKAVLVVQRRIGSAPLIKDLQGSAVVNSIH